MPSSSSRWLSRPSAVIQSVEMSGNQDLQPLGPAAGAIIADVRLATEADLAIWQDFVDRSADARCMHHAGWFLVLQKAFKVRPTYLFAVDGTGAVQGVLPAYLSRSIFAGHCLSSLEGGTLSASAEANRALLQAALTLRDNSGAQYLQLRGGTVHRAPAVAVPTVHTIIETHRPREQLWAAIAKKTRWAVRKAEQAGIVVEHDPMLERLHEFYLAYARRMRDLGTPVSGWAPLAAMRKCLGVDRLRLYVVKHHGRTLGGMLCVTHGNRWTDLYAAVNGTDATQFANYLLYWRAISDASGLGVTSLDLGRSTPGSGVHLFKRKWGGIDVDVPYHFYAAAGANPRDMGLQRMKREKRLLQRAWSRLPLPFANRLGPLLRSQLPFI